MQENQGRPGKPADDSATDTDSDGERIRSRQPEKVPEKPHQHNPQPETSKPEIPCPPVVNKIAIQSSLPLKRKAASGKTRSTGISLQQLVENNLLQPGKDVLMVEYKSQVIKADLTEAGTILYMYDGVQHTYESPSAFSIAVKRQINPSRKADDGWKTVKYQGKFLEFYKKKLQEHTGVVKSGIQQPVKKVKISNGNLHENRLASSGAERPIQQCVASSPQKVGRNLEAESSLTPCQQFRGDPYDGIEGSQPFRVELSSAAAMFMDLHAHLSENEVIGLLTGEWDASDRCLRVRRAYPVQEIRTENDMGSVQMNPDDQRSVKVSALQGLRCVGWYHSHPHARPDPSPADTAFQIQRQREDSLIDGQHCPQLGMIVSPYKAALPNGQAGMTFFQAQTGHTDSGTQQDWHAVEFKYKESGNINDASYWNELQQNLIERTAKWCFATTRHGDLSKLWKEGVSRKHKLIRSVTSRLPEIWDGLQKSLFLQRMEQILADAFSLSKTKKEDEPEISQSTDSGSEKGALHLQRNGNSSQVAGQSKLQSTSQAGKRSPVSQSFVLNQASRTGLTRSNEDASKLQPGTEIRHATSTEVSNDGTQDFSGLDGKNFFDSDHNLIGLDNLPEIDSLGKLEDW